MYHKYMKYHAQVMEEKKLWFRVQILILLTLMLIPAVYILSVSIPRLLNGLRLIDRGTYTIGKVIFVEPLCKYRDYYHRVCFVRTIEFTDSTGEKRQFESFGNLNLKYKKGQSVGLYYDPNNPESAVIDDKWRIIRLELPTILSMSIAVVIWIFFGLIPVLKQYQKIRA